MEHRLKPKAEQILKTRAEELDLLVPIREGRITNCQRVVSIVFVFFWGYDEMLNGHLKNWIRCSFAWTSTQGIKCQWPRGCQSL